MSEATDQILAPATADSGSLRPKLAAAGGLLGALAASACCIVPLLLFSLGIGGAWIGRLGALQPYQPLFIAFSLGLVGYGYWLVYRKAKQACVDNQACARPLPNQLVKGTLWGATILIVLAIAWPYLVPVILS